MVQPISQSALESFFLPRLQKGGLHRNKKELIFVLSCIFAIFIFAEKYFQRPTKIVNRQNIVIVKFVLV